MNIAMRLGAILLLGYLAVNLLLFLLQGRMIFFPRSLASTPVGANIREVSVQRPDAVLRGWVVNAGTRGPLLVYFGGNAEELSGAVPTFARLPAVAALVNYRGYGASDGAPTAAALLEDAVAVVESLRERYGAGRATVLFGRSLGSGLAALAAAETKADGVILFSPYRSIERIAQQRYPFVPVRWLLRHNIDAGRVAPSLAQRALALYATDDRVVPTAESRALVSLLPDGARVVEFQGGHGMPLETPRIWAEITAFLGSFAKGSPAAMAPPADPAA